MIEALLAQYLDRSKLLDDRAWPCFLEHERFTGPGALDYNKRAAEILARMGFEHGAKNGTFHVLPLDQFLEHPAGNWFGAGQNEAYANPKRMLTLTADLDFNGVVLHPGWAEIHRAMESPTPLILKISGTTMYAPKASGGRYESDILYESVADAVRAAQELKAAAIGYTYYMGSPSTAFVHRDYARAREIAKKAGLPLIVWGYGRGLVIDAMGRDSFVSVMGDVNSSIAIGAHILKVNPPKNLTKDEEAFALENYGAQLLGIVEWQRGKPSLQMIRELVRVAHDSGVGIGFSGGSKKDGIEVVDIVQDTAEGGADAVFNGRNTSTAEDDVVGFEDTNVLAQVELIKQVRRVLAEYPRTRP